MRQPTIGENLAQELNRWLQPYTAALRHKTRALMLGTYVRELIAPDGRKTIQMMAARASDVTYDQLHHFLTSAAWDEAPLEAMLRESVARQLSSGPSPWLVFSEAAFVKKGEHSVGVALQFANSLGRAINCQSLIHASVTASAAALPVAMRLHLPQSWTTDAKRLGQAGVPEVYHAYHDKPALLLREVESLRAAQLAPACVLVDTGFALAPRLRQGLDAQGLPWALVIPEKAGEADSEPTPEFLADTGPTRITAASAAWLLAQAQWQPVSWRAADKTRRAARFVAIRLNIRDRGQADETPVWLLGEKAANGDSRYYLANLSAKATIRQLAAALKNRQIAAEGQAMMRDELGLEQFEGRSWVGLHRHCLMVMMAAIFRQTR